MPKKLAALAIISRELATDSSPRRAAGRRRIAGPRHRPKLDLAVLRQPQPPTAQRDRVRRRGRHRSHRTSPITWTDSRKRSARFETAGATCTAFVTAPATALALAQLKKLPTDSNEPLLAADAASPTKRAWPVCRCGSAQPSQRTPFGRSDKSPQLRGAARRRHARRGRIRPTSPATGSAIRVTLRAAFGFAHPASIVKITHRVTTLRRTGFTPFARQQGARPPSDGSGTRAPHRQSRSPQPCDTAQATTVARARGTGACPCRGAEPR